MPLKESCLFYLLTARDSEIEKKSTFDEVAEDYVSISASDSLLALTFSPHGPKTEI